MQLKNNFFAVLNTIKKHFLMPFCLSASLVLIVVSIFEIQVPLINPLVISYSGLTFGFLAFFLWFKELGEESKARKIIVEFSAPVFLMSLFLVTLFNLNIWTTFDLPQKTNLILTITAIFSGFITFYVNRERVDKEIEKEQNDELVAEQKRSVEFSERFPRINNVPILRSLTKWSHREGWGNVFGLLAIIGFGLFVRSWGLENLGFWFDEGLSVLMAHSFLTDSFFTFPSGVFYERALPYHEYLGYLYLFFHKIISENVLLRIANLPFYVVNSFLIYHLSKKVVSKHSALFIVFLFSSSWIAVSMFREVRFYEFSLMTFLLTTFIFIKSFDYFTFNKIRDFNLVVRIVLLLIVFYVGFLVHPLIVIFLYILVVFYFLMSIKNRNLEYLLISLVSFSAIFTGMFFLIKKTFPFIENFNLSYVFKLPLSEWVSISQSNSLDNVFNYLLLNGHVFNLIILITLPAIILLSRRKEELFIFVSLITSYLFLSYQGYDSNSIRYFYIVIPFLLVSFVLISVRIFKNQKYFIFIFILLLIPYIQTSYQEITSTYSFDSKNTMKSFDYNSAFSVIEKQKPCEVYTDMQISIPYYIHFSKNPAGIIYDPSAFNIDTPTDPYLGIPYSNYNSISPSSCKTYFVFIYMRTQISEKAWGTLNQKGGVIFKDKALLIYEIF